MKQEAATTEHEITVTTQKLSEVHNIEEWRLRMLLRKLEVRLLRLACASAPA